MKKTQQQLTQTLQVGDLTIASSDQVPYLQTSDPNLELAATVNFLRSGCPLVQVAFARAFSEQDEYWVRDFRFQLDSISLEGETFEVSEPKNIEGSNELLISVKRHT